MYLCMYNVVKCCKYLFNFKAMKNFALIIFLLVISVFVNAQDYVVSFAAFGITSEVDSVQVENVSQGKSISVDGSDVLNLLGVISLDKSNTEIQGLTVYPNPTGDYANLNFYSEAAELVNIAIFDISGKLIVEQVEMVNHGSNSFRLSGLKQGMYIVNIRSKNFHYNANLVVSGLGSGEVKIQNKETDFVVEKTMKSAKSVVQWQYDEGDLLIFKGFSSGHSRIYVYYVTSDAIVNFDFVLCQDSDGAKYSVVAIGGELWMAENLRTTKYNNGIPLDKVEGGPGWADLTDGSYCYYNDDSLANALKYGALYNFAAVNTGNLCPNGWHVPSLTEWQDLTIFLQNSGYNYNGFVDTDNDSETNEKTAKSLSASSDWITSDVVGTPGNTDYSDYRNRTGFSAKPAGMLNPDVGNTSSMGMMASWWTATENNSLSSWKTIVLYNQENTQIMNSGTKTHGMSVRCLKD